MFKFPNEGDQRTNTVRPKLKEVGPKAHQPLKAIAAAKGFPAQETEGGGVNWKPGLPEPYQP